MSYYRVFLVKRIGTPRNHYAIFVETNDDDSGIQFHVTGNIQNGMNFEQLQEERPENAITFVTKSLLGWVKINDLPRIHAVCTSIPPPKKQFDGPRRLYPDEPLWRCQEWIKEAIEALRDADILLPMSA